MARFYAFAPRLAPPPESSAPLKPAELPVRLHHTDPLLEIQLIEAEWRESIQPTNLIEETLCGQLAHATWHLRELNRTEREAIAHSVRNRSFDGDAALRLMQWRRSSEASIEAAPAQLAAYRGQPQAALAAGPGDLHQLAKAIGSSAPRTVVASRK
jgi:hypothetical protein